MFLFNFIYHKYIIDNQAPKLMNSLKNSKIYSNLHSVQDFSGMTQFGQLNCKSASNLYESLRDSPQITTFLIKIPEEEFQRQNSVYRWRLERPNNIIGLLQYKLIPNLISLNSRRLVKVVVQPYLHTISQLASMNLIKCLNFIKEVLNGTIALRNKFGPKIIKSNNIVIDKNNEAKVWYHENFQLNPGNFQKDPEHLVCDGLVKIFKKLCLNTKLSQRFFLKIQKCKHLQEILEQVCQFQKSQHLFSLDFSHKTASTSLNSSVKNLNFSEKCIQKKKKKNIQKVQSLPYFAQSFQCKTLFSQASIKKSQFLNDQRVKSHCFVQNKDGKIQISPKYSSTTYMTHTKGESGFLSPLAEKAHETEIKSSKVKNQSSFVISEIYHDDCDDKLQNAEEGIKIQIKSQIRQKAPRQRHCFGSQQMLNQGWSTCLSFPKVQKIYQIQSEEQSNKLSISLGESKRLAELREETLKSQFIEDEKAMNPFQIIVKNGWSTDLFKLMNVPVMKNSITVGKQQNNYLKQYNLAKLDKLGRNIHQSFMPLEEQDHSFQI